MWSVLILVFKCLGPERVGFLSGSNFVQTTESHKRPSRIRLIFLNSSLLVIIFSILLVTNGLGNLQRTVTTLDSSNAEVDKIAFEADIIVDGMIIVGSQSAGIRDVIVSNLGNFCPGEPDIKGKTGIDFDAIAVATIEKLAQLKDFIENNADDLQNALQRVNDGTADLDDALQYADATDWRVKMVVVPLVIVPAIMFVGVGLAWFDISNDTVQCILSWFILPIFVFLITFMWLLCSSLGMIITSHSDLCMGGEGSGSPDGSFQEILSELDVDKSTLLYESLIYFSQGCKEDYPFEFIDDYIVELADGFSSVVEFELKAEIVGVDRLETLCSKDFTELLDSMSLLKQNLRSLDTSASTALGLLSCPRINSLYANTFHEATCTSSIKGETWVFVCLLLISIFGMLMITFRASWKDTEYYKGALTAVSPDIELYDQKSEQEAPKATYDCDEEESEYSAGMEVSESSCDEESFQEEHSVDNGMETSLESSTQSWERTVPRISSGGIVPPATPPKSAYVMRKHDSFKVTTY